MKGTGGQPNLLGRRNLGSGYGLVCFVHNAVLYLQVTCVMLFMMIL